MKIKIEILIEGDEQTYAALRKGSFMDSFVSSVLIDHIEKVIDYKFGITNEEKL